jgi:transposase
VFCQDLGKLAAPRTSTTRRCARYVLRRLMIDRTTISAIATELGVSWHTVTRSPCRPPPIWSPLPDPTGWPGAGDRGRRAPLGTPTSRGRRVRHRHHRPHPVMDKTGLARCSTWWRAARRGPGHVVGGSTRRVRPGRVIAMDGFAGYKTTAADMVPDAVTVMDPFHVVALARPSWTRSANAFSSRPSGGAGIPATHSTGSGASPGPAPACSQPASTTA